MSEILYEVGRIYKLVSDNGLIYIGSTTKTLTTRFICHKKSYDRFLESKGGYISSIKLFENDSKVIIELIEEHKQISKNDLQARERFYIENTKCVNIAIPTRTVKEYYKANKDKILEKNRMYNEANKEKLIEQGKHYYEKNKDKILERNRMYNEVKKEELKEYRKEKYDKDKEKYKQESQKYRIANKEKIKDYNVKNKEKLREKTKEIILCDNCKCNIQRGSKARHQRSQKCVFITNNYITNNITTSSNIINN